MSEAVSGDDKQKQGLFSSTLLMASGTVMSRVFGAIRVLLVAYILGANTPQSEIFAVASTVPNSMYMLLAGGILNAVLVPQLVRAIKNDPDRGEAFTNRLVTLIVLFLIAATVLLVLGAPVIANLASDAAWHTVAAAPKFRSLILLTTLCLPQVFFYGVFVVCGQILNARGSFGPMMWAPVANNIIQIFVLGGYALTWGFQKNTSDPFTWPQMLVLGIGSVVGVALQIVILVPFLKKVGFSYRPRFDFRHTGLGHVANIAKWAIALALVNQVNYLIVTRLGTVGTADGEGAGNAAFNAANLIWILPHALITVSLVTALVPRLSRLSAAADMGGYTREFISIAKFLSATIIPLSMVYVALGIPIATMAFRGNVGGMYIGWTLSILGVCLFPSSLQYLIVKAFNSLENTRTPFFLQVIIVFVWCGLATVLIKAIQVPSEWVAPSMAAAYASAYILAGFLSWVLLRRKVPEIVGQGVGRHVFISFAISLPGTILGGFATWSVKAYFSGFIADILGLLLGIGIAGGVYLVVAKLARVKELDDLITALRRRLIKH